MHLDAVQNWNTSTIFPVSSSLSGCNVELADVYLQSEFKLRKRKKKKEMLCMLRVFNSFDHNVDLRHKKVGALR